MFCSVFLSLTPFTLGPPKYEMLLLALVTNPVECVNRDTAQNTAMKLLPNEFGLPPRTVLEQIDDNTIAIVVDRKSRIVMADGKKILEKAQKIEEIRPLASIVLKTTAPVCSKTMKFLEAEKISLI